VVAVTVVPIAGSLALFLVADFKGARALQAVASFQDACDAVGQRGIALEYPDGSWIAIYYDDVHSGVSWSLAIARDSAGAWYESDRHFCGALESLRAGLYELRQLPAGLAAGDPVLAELCSRLDRNPVRRLSEASGLPAAKEELHALGFESR